MYAYQAQAQQILVMTLILTPFVMMLMTALGNTTIAVVATDARLTKDQAQRLAVMAQDGLARAIRPVHAPFDGDVVFALSTERRELPEPSAYTLTRLGNLAADCLTRSIARAVHQARP